MENRNKDEGIYKVPYSEQFTSIIIARDTDYVYLETSDRIVIRKMQEHVEKSEQRGDYAFQIINEVKKDGLTYSREYKFPKNLLIIRDARLLQDDKKKEQLEHIKHSFQKYAKS